MKNATLLLVAVFFSTIYGQQVKYDPETGEPLTEEPHVQYDPNTGEPIQSEKQVQYDPGTGIVTGSADTLVTTTGKIILGKYLGQKNNKVLFQRGDSIMESEIPISSVKEIRTTNGRLLMDTPKQKTFNLKSGDQVTGAILNETAEEITLSHPVMGQITISRDQIKEKTKAKKKTITLKSGDQVTGTILNETTEEITLSHPAMGQITIRRDQIADTGPYRTGSTQYPPAMSLSTYQIQQMARENALLDHDNVRWILIGAVSGVTGLFGGVIGADLFDDIELGFWLGGAAGLFIPYAVANQLYPDEISYPPDLQNKKQRDLYHNSYIKKTRKLRISSMMQGPVYGCGGLFLLAITL